MCHVMNQSIKLRHLMRTIIQFFQQYFTIKKINVHTPNTISSLRNLNETRNLN